MLSLVDKSANWIFNQKVNVDKEIIYTYMHAEDDEKKC